MKTASNTGTSCHQGAAAATNGQIGCMVRRRREWDNFGHRPANHHVDYLAAHFAKSQLWHASTLLFGFFLTEACELDSRTMGLVLAASLALNAAMDAAVGLWRSSRVLTLATAARQQALAAPATCLCFLMFSATPLLDIAQRTWWTIVTLIAFRICFPFVDVPQNTMVVWIAHGSDSRCWLLARRNIASGLASLMVAGSAAPLLIHARSVIGWLAWASCVSLIVCVTAWRLRGMASGPATKPSLNDADGGVRLPFALLLGALAVMMIAAATFRSLEPYYAAFAGKSVGLLWWVAIGGMASQPCWNALHRRVGATVMLSMVAAMLLLAALVLLGPWRAEPIGAAVLGLGFGAGASGLWLMLWEALMARSATGRPTGHVGVFTCVSKLAQAAAMLLLGQTLARSPYRETLADPWSAPSLLMAAALVAIAGVSLVLMSAVASVSREASRETPAKRHPAPRPGQAAEQRHRAESQVPARRDARARPPRAIPLP